MALSVSRLVRVAVNLSPLAASRRSFGVLMIAGDSDVISAYERYRTYLTIEGVAADFGVDAPEYNAAALYFGQSPKPQTLMIGRWLRTASAGFNNGGILSPSEQAIANFNAISDGGFTVVIDGVTKTLNSLDFTAETNLNGVASVINASLTGGEIEWNGSEFVLTSATTGAGSRASGSITVSTNPSYGVRASGTIELTGQPDPSDTVTIKGTTVTFVSGTPTGNQVQIGGSAALTSAALQTFLAASADANLAANIYNTVGQITTITARVYGTAGNAYGLLKSGANITVSGATLSGGVAADTVTVNGTAITFVPSNATGNQVVVAPTAAGTAGNLQTFLEDSVDSNIDDATYSLDGTVITVTAVDTGTGGNSFTLAETGTSITVSGATLSGGTVTSTVGYATAASGTNISALLKLSSSTSLGLVNGYDAETPVECAAALADASAAWYGLMFQASTQPTDQQNLDVCDFIEALSLKRIFGVTITNTNVLSAVVSNDLASLMKAGAYKQSFCQYSQNAYAIASMFGRAFSVNFNANRSTITLMYKQEPSVAAENLSENQATVLKDKRCNVFVSYVNDTNIIQYGTMSGPAYFDEIHGLDWFQDAVQNQCYNVLYQTTSKVPQTDAGVNQITNAISQACEEAVNNGLVAPGVWTSSDSFGELTTGQYLKSGYYIYAQPISLQSQSDREARLAPPIQVAIKLAGAIQEVDVIVDVNR